MHRLRQLHRVAPRRDQEADERGDKFGFGHGGSKLTVGKSVARTASIDAEYGGAASHCLEGLQPDF
jgi:hypothetical protein